MPSASDFFSWLSNGATFAEQHPTVSVCVMILLLAFGTPEIGPSEKPWIKARSGLAWLATNALAAYLERTAVFKGLEVEVKVFREKMTALADRVGESEKVVSWQTQVLMAISSALKIDVLTLLGKQDSPVSTITRESIPDIGGQQGKKSGDAPTVAG